MMLAVLPGRADIASTSVEVHPDCLQIKPEEIGSQICLLVHGSLLTPIDRGRLAAHPPRFDVAANADVDMVSAHAGVVGYQRP